MATQNYSQPRGQQEVKQATTPCIHARLVIGDFENLENTFSLLEFYKQSESLKGSPLGQSLGQKIFRKIYKWKLFGTEWLAMPKEIDYGNLKWEWRMEVIIPLQTEGDELFFSRGKMAN